MAKKEKKRKETWFIIINSTQYPYLGLIYIKPICGLGHDDKYACKDNT